MLSIHISLCLQTDLSVIDVRFKDQIKCMMFVWFLLEVGALDQNQRLRDSFFA